MVGGYRDWNVDDRGFYRDELAESSSGRWTNGEATVMLPLIRADTLQVLFTVPGKAPRPVKLTLNDAVLHEGLLSGTQRLTFPLSPAVAASSPRELRIVSAVFVPKAAGKSTDARVLGVFVAAVRQFDSRSPRLGAASDNAAYRSRVHVMGAPLLPALTIDSPSAAPRLTIAVSNLGDSVLPAGADARSGEVPVAIGLVWRRVGDPAAALEQRIPLAHGLYPGERLLATPTLKPRQPDGTALPAGDYVLEIDLVQEHVTWFAPRGGAAARLPVSISSEYAKGR